MIYVLDTSSIVVLKNFYPSRFPSLWKSIDQLLKSERLLSTREVLNELESREGHEFILSWAKTNKHIFAIPGNEELKFVNQIFSVSHFQSLISLESLLKGSPVADPLCDCCSETEGWMRCDRRKQEAKCGQDSERLRSFRNCV